MDDELLYLLANEVGKILQWEEECPGVYYLSVLPEDEKGSGLEYYAVFENAPISQEVRTMGKRLETVPAWVYLLDSEEGPRWAVYYEILKYKTMHNHPLPEGESLQDAALYGMELCPDYFGTYPVPPQTPWGRTLRHRPLDNGIYWMETDQCAEVLAVSYPMWEGELSEGVQTIAKRLEHEGEFGYLYFSKQAACVAIWELLRTRSELTALGLIRKAELMNAIWQFYPEYAMGFNAQEQAGLHDGMGLLLYALGAEDRKLEGAVENMIAMTTDTGNGYIGFWM